jgi:predicted transposase YbfD/YdcC
MKKNLIIIILSIITLASLIFGYSQMQKADKKEALAEEYSEALKEKERQHEIVRERAEEYSKKALEEVQKIRKEAEMGRKDE